EQRTNPPGKPEQDTFGPLIMRNNRVTLFSAFSENPGYAQKLPLEWAVQEGLTQIAGLLLDRGADGDAVLEQHQTLLNIAVAQGNREMIQELLRRGANIKATDGAGATALMAAMQAGKTKGRDELILYLIDQGLDINGISPAVYARRPQYYDGSDHSDW